MDLLRTTMLFVLATGVAHVPQDASYAQVSDPRHPPADGLPGTLDVAAVLRPPLEQTWRASPTFRRQCQRLASAELPVHVRAHPVTTLNVSHHASTTMAYQEGRVVSARIDVPLLSPKLAELVAHELEHVIEQLDGVDLARLAGSGDVWRSGAQAYETRRAIDAGRRVAHEIAATPEFSPSTVTSPGATATGMAPLLTGPSPMTARPVHVSGDGRHVAFSSPVALIAHDRNGMQDVYVLNLATQTLTLESMPPGGNLADGDSRAPALSRNGRFLVFESVASNLTGVRTVSAFPQVYVRDRETGITSLVSVRAAGGPGNGPSGSPTISADGTTIAFASGAPDLSGAEHPSDSAVAVYVARADADGVWPGALSIVSASATGPSVSPSVSADGRLVAFMSRAPITPPPDTRKRGFSPADGTGMAAVYVHDTMSHTTTRVTTGHQGDEANGPSFQPAISGNGRYVAFVSEASHLTRGVRRGAAQVYVHDLAAGTTELVSHSSRGGAANGPSLRPAISHDGQRIAFQSLGSDLTCPGAGSPADTDLLSDVFVRDRVLGYTVRADLGGTDASESSWPALDDGGAVVAFVSGRPARVVTGAVAPADGARPSAASGSPAGAGRDARCRPGPGAAEPSMRLVPTAF